MLLQGFDLSGMTGSPISVLRYERSSSELSNANSSLLSSSFTKAGEIYVGSHYRGTRHTSRHVLMNLRGRTQVTDRETEEELIAMDKLNNWFLSTKFLLKVQEDNLLEELEEINKARKSLNKTIGEIADRKNDYVLRDQFKRYLQS